MIAAIKVGKMLSVRLSQHSHTKQFSTYHDLRIIRFSGLPS